MGTSGTAEMEEGGMALALFDGGRRRRRRVVEALYAVVMARSRRPELFRELEIPDTLDGRFDALTLHMVLLLHRLKADGETTRELAQDLFDLMFADVDRSLREMGVGDHSIGRRIKQMISAFYGRARAYEEALAGPEGALQAALRRNIYRSATTAEDKVDALAAHVRGVLRGLEGQSIDSLMRGELAMEPPPSQKPEDR